MPHHSSTRHQSSERFKRFCRLLVREINGSLVIVDLISHHHLSLRVKQLSPSRHHLVSSTIECDTHLLLVLRSRRKYFRDFGRTKQPHLTSSAVYPPQSLHLPPVSVGPRLGLHLCSYPNIQNGPRHCPAIILLFCCRILYKYLVEVHRLVTAGPVVPAPRTSPRRLAVRLPTMQKFVSYHTPKRHTIGHGLACPSLKGHWKQ